MYTKDLVRRVTIRLDDRLAQRVTECSETLGVTPSEWVRMVLHSYVNVLENTARLAEVGAKSIASTEKAAQHEDKKTDIDDNV